MSFVEIQFPPKIAFGSSGGPLYVTEVSVSASGYEQRNVLWSAARLRYNVAHGVKTKAQMDELIAFFRARKGRAYGFRFKDWSDYQATGQVLGTGNGSRTQFELVKHYSSGNVVETRRIHKAVAGTVKIYVNGILQTGGYSADMNIGLISFSAPVGSGAVVSADFEFDVPVRFDTDHLSAEWLDLGFHSWRDIPLIEIRL